MGEIPRLRGLWRGRFRASSLEGPFIPQGAFPEYPAMVPVSNARVVGRVSYQSSHASCAQYLVGPSGGKAG